MILEMHDNTTIEDLQEKFSGFYNHLKLDFYKGPHGRFESSDEKAAFSSDHRLGEIRRIHEQGEWEIHSGMKAGDLEQTFRKKYGLNVQVLVRAGSEWIQTTNADNLSLLELNDLGKGE